MRPCCEEEVDVVKLVDLVPGKGGGWNSRGEVLLLRMVDGGDGVSRSRR